MIARVFPRLIPSATPNDTLSFVGAPPISPFIPKEISEIHISVTFTWDIPAAQRLAESWSRIGPVKIGGPTLGDRGGDFTPGRYLKPGYVITSRGCPNKCWFCSVPGREGEVRELPIAAGSNVLDDNILACSDRHIEKVFEMLSRQKRVEFTGGLEAARLKEWHVRGLRAVSAKQVFFAYDSPEKFQALEKAVGMMFSGGFTPKSKSVRAYVLVGFPGDTFEKAGARLNQCLSIGAIPMKMPFRAVDGKEDSAWKHFGRQWARPAMMKPFVLQEIG